MLHQNLGGPRPDYLYEMFIEQVKDTNKYEVCHRRTLCIQPPKGLGSPVVLAEKNLYANSGNHVSLIDCVPNKHMTFKGCKIKDPNSNLCVTASWPTGVRGQDEVNAPLSWKFCNVPSFQNEDKYFDFWSF
jgi:hypothetical protein